MGGGTLSTASGFGGVSLCGLLGSPEVAMMKPARVAARRLISSSCTQCGRETHAYLPRILPGGSQCPVPARIDLQPPAKNVEQAFEDACAELGLKIHRGTLAKYEESVHWHLNMSRQKGTLEATWWPTNHKLWLEVRANREAEWMKPVIDSLVGKF
jgi:hypothetical protein